MQLINRERAVVVDVREPEEFAAGHVTGAKNVPLNQLEEKLAAAVKNKTVPLLLVCATGRAGPARGGRGQETRLRASPSRGRRAEILERG